MLTSIGNIHHSKLPQPGEIGRIVGLENHGISSKRTCIVRSFPLCDNVWPWSMGIHTVSIEFLDNRESKRISGFYFHPDEAWDPRPRARRRMATRR